MTDSCSCGDCIVTSGTLNNLPKEAVDQLGLIEGHCYCICRVVFILVLLLQMETVDGVRLLQIRNPWGNSSWKGPYSYRDSYHWTPRLQVCLLGYSFINRPYVLIINIVYNILITMMVYSGWNSLTLFVITEACKFFFISSSFLVMSTGLLLS